MSTAAAATEERGIVEYQARDGQKVKLSPAIIKKYLVSGKAEFVTDQELYMYMGLCKSRGLNPFIRDAFIVKYTPNEGAAIITSIDYYRKRARAQADCKGWKVGIVIQKAGELVYRSGCILLENEILVGGWAEAIPAGWTEPMRKEVNLKRYIKKTRDGSVTRFWSEENQPEMIAKVAESQLLRALWPDEFQGLYVDSEMQSRDAQDDLNVAVSTASDEPEKPAQMFEQAFAAEIADPMFSKFIAETAKTYNTGVDTVRADMLNQVEEVKAGFAQWRARYQKPAENHAEPASTPEADTDNNEPDSGKGATNGGTPAETKPAANGTAAGPSKEDAFRSEWINLKPQGFGKYVERNVERFKAAPPWVRDEALAKWKKFYAGYPCPIGQTSTETAAEMAAEIEGEAQGQEIATPADTQQAPPPDRQPSAAADVQRLKIIEEIKRYHEAVVMEAKRRIGLSIMPSAWPPSLEGAGRLFDMVQAVAAEKGMGPK